jgi:Raf kinase inhibitor-like YbhB/YbcL family protein
MSLGIFSTAFGDGENIPARYTADGRDISPALNWCGAPPKTAALALILHDPDAPRSGGFTHWIIFNLPADSTGLSEGVQRRERLGNGATQGKNDGGIIGYMGPSPPPGKVHHYRFILYALDQPLALSAKAGRRELLEAIKGHILTEAETVGLYQR